MPFVIYSVAYPEARAGDPMIREFSDWAHREAALEGVAPATRKPEGGIR
jgi:LysR family glycine cleavage system transcriptional activator